MKKIPVNADYEIEYRYSGFDKTKVFNKDFSIILLKRGAKGNRVVLRADNNHDLKTNKWAVHIHTADGNNHFSLFFGGTDESNFETFKKQIIEYAVKQISSENKEDLEAAFEQIKFP